MTKSTQAPQNPLDKSVLLAGPTAVGKSELAVLLAEAIGGEIVSADAFQIYEGLDILTAKPAPEYLSRIPHHLVGAVPLSQSFDTAQWREAALAAIQQITGKGNIPIISGGTGLYFRALTHGLADLPGADPEIRAELASYSLEELQSRLAEHDPVAMGWIDLKNRRRVERAIEVCLLTGKPFSSFRTESVPANPAFRAVFLERDREELYSRINLRTEAMFAEGVLEEVGNTPADRLGMTASQVLGYADLRAHLAGEISRAEAIERIQQATRHYAKRQLTWFRKDTTFSSLNLTELRTTKAALQRLLELGMPHAHFR